jgi:Ni,Fe-hydrogenase III small subunit
MAWEKNSFQRFYHNPAYQSLHQQMSSSPDSCVDTAGFVQLNFPGCRPSPTAMLTSAAAAAAAAFEFIAPVSKGMLN